MAARALLSLWSSTASLVASQLKLLNNRIYVCRIAGAGSLPASGR